MRWLCIMIKLKLLRQYPVNVLDKALIENVTVLANSKSDYNRDLTIRMLAVLNVFCDITSTRITFIKLNHPKFIHHVLYGFIGFAYTTIKATNSNIYSVAQPFLRTFEQLCQNNHIFKCTDLKISQQFISEDAQESIRYYNSSFEVNHERLAFYSGWKVEDNTRFVHYLNLVDCYNRYGSVFTKKLHTALLRIAFRGRKASFQSKIHLFNSLMRTFIQFFIDFQSFNQAMSALNLHTSMAAVYNMQLLEAKSQGLCLKTFHQKWANEMMLFKEVFIEHYLVAEPLIELFVPKFKTSGTQITSKTRVKHDIQGNAFNNKLITPIPLSYSDNKAKEAIFDSIKADINHVTFHCKNLVDETMQCYERFQLLKSQGQVKQRTEIGRGCNPVDMSLQENVCATYDHYGCNPPVQNVSYVNFIGYSGKTTDLNELVCLPTPYILYPFLLLLIEQHPAITDSWLINWNLYDRHGRLHGFKQLKQTWVAVSEKARKGSSKAQQTIVLNDVSKYLIEKIIQLTAHARGLLKAQGSDDSRAMLISTMSVCSQPRRLPILLPIYSKSVFRAVIGTRMQQNSLYRSQKKAVAITNSLTFTSMRASCGIRVYLETQSVHAMAEALGHETYIPQLISHYLPQPLWNYFTNRWVRLFQNAVVYEAMKDSVYLFDVMDIREDEIDDFLNAHGLGELPLQIKAGKLKAKDIANDEIRHQIESAVLMISVGLLQVLFAIISFVNNASDTEKITTVAKHWFETALFISTHIDMTLDDKVNGTLNISNDIRDIYLLAKNNPIELSVIKEAVLC